MGTPALGGQVRAGQTCGRRLRDWNGSGVGQRLHEVLPTELNAVGRLDWSRSDRHTGPSPVDRGRPGPTPKHHQITDGHGTPLAVTLTGGSLNDVTQLPPILEAVLAVRGRVGRPF